MAKMLSMRLDIGEFVKLALSSFMIEGVRSLVAFRLEPGVLSYYTTEAGALIIIEVEEPQECMDSDYYVLRISDSDVAYACRKGLPSRHEIERGGIVFIIKPQSLELSEV